MEPNNSISRLRELRGSGYEIVDDQPDIIGWTIKDSENRKLGVVDDLLFDEQLQKVRYLVANLKGNDYDLERRRVLIPIGIVELHENSDDVIVPSVSPWQLRALPNYGQRVTDVDEQEIYTVFSAAPATARATSNWQKPQDFYDNPTYNHDNIYRNRRKAELKDAPIQRSFRQKPGYTPATPAYDDRPGSNEYETRRETVHEREQMAVRNQQNRTSDTENLRSTADDNSERIINKIHRMQEELNEIERDLRNSRDI